jgi:hypothetical protein
MGMKITVRMQWYSTVQKDSRSARLFVVASFLLLQKKKSKKVLYNGIQNYLILLKEIRMDIALILTEKRAVAIYGMNEGREAANMIAEKIPMSG